MAGVTLAFEIQLKVEWLTVEERPLLTYLIRIA
jgi:hypothetical protein